MRPIFARLRSCCVALALALVAMLHVPAAMAEQGSDTPQCKEAVSRILEATGASFDHVSPSGDNVFLSHPAASSIVLSCRPGQPPNIDVGIGQAFPPNDYFVLLAQSGAVITKAPRDTLEREIRDCQRAALKSSEENEELHQPHVQIDCTAFMRDGGGTSIDIVPEEQD